MSAEEALAGSREAEPPPTHDGPCVESLDGDDEPLGYCVICYQPMTPPSRPQSSAR